MEHTLNIWVRFKMRVTAIKCDKCFDIIYSRARHDFRSCTCGSVSIDGGRDYTKISFRENPPEPFAFEIEGITASDLYNDWNKRIDKYGIIKGGTT